MDKSKQPFRTLSQSGFLGVRPFRKWAEFCVIETSKCCKTLVTGSFTTPEYVLNKFRPDSRQSYSPYDFFLSDWSREIRPDFSDTDCRLTEQHLFASIRVEHACVALKCIYKYIYILKIVPLDFRYNGCCILVGKWL